MTLRATLRRWSAEHVLVQEAADRRNLHVAGIASWGVVSLNLLHVVAFGLADFDDPLRDAWAHRIMVAHGVMGLFMVAAGWFARRMQSAGRRARWLPEVVSLLLLIWAVALTVIDQAVGASINAFISAAIGIAVVFVLRPLSAMLILILGWCALACGLGWATQEAVLVMSNRMNAASACILALLVSLMSWRRYVQSELLQRALTESNRTLEHQRAELEALATRDPLTGLVNRREFVRRAEQALAHARRQGSALSLLMVDLDNFKIINDRFGHPAGDEVLRRAAELMVRAVRQTDTVARLGGEEFVLLLPGMAEADAMRLADELRNRLAGTRIAGLDAPVTASVGVASFSVDADPTLNVLLQRADQALYQAKHGGRNRTVAAGTARARNGVRLHAVEPEP